MIQSDLFRAFGDKVLWSSIEDFSWPFGQTQTHAEHVNDSYTEV